MRNKWLIGTLLMLACGAAAAQVSKLTPSKARIGIKDTGQDAESLLVQLKRERMSLNIKLLSDNELTKNTEAKLDYRILQQGKELAALTGVPVQLTPDAKSLPLFEYGLEEAMIVTWEKQGFIRRQVGRIETEPKGGKLGKPDDPTTKRGFIRRQVGRIPKQEYQVEVSLHVPGRTGTTQPAQFLVTIN